MDYLSLLFIFVFGTLVGSFINVVSLRYNTGLSSYNGRSKCFHCDRQLLWYEMIPVLSFLFLGGRCRTCKSKLSVQYPIVEFLTGIVFVTIVLRQMSLWTTLYSTFENGFLYSVLFCVYYAFIFSLLMVIAVYDIRHKVIPDGLVYTFIFLSFLKLILFVYCKGFILTSGDSLDLLAPVLLFLPFAFLWYVSSGRWIGFGDAKLALGIGALLGFVSGVSTITIAFWVGALWSITLYIYSRIFLGTGLEIGLETEVPFAPFMIFATVLVFFSGIDPLSLGNLLNFLY